ncbi:MAG: folate family ECF transporter S component [Lachnospiraceae bacterium]
MKQIKLQFIHSWKELKDIKTLVVTAMLVAIAVVLSFYTIQVSDYLKFGFSFLANELTALLFGPVVGGTMAGVADIVKYLIHPTGPFFFGFTLNAILGGIIYGIILYRKPLSLKRIFCAKLTVSIVINMLLSTYWLSMLYGNAFMALFPVRAIKQLLMLPLETVLFYIVAKALSKANILSRVAIKF